MLIDANNLDDNDDANHDNDTIKITPVVQVWSWSVQRYGGKRLLGMEAGKPLCIFADTRAEWMVSAQACFRWVLN